MILRPSAGACVVFFIGSSARNSMGKVTSLGETQRVKIRSITRFQRKFVFGPPSRPPQKNNVSHRTLKNHSMGIPMIPRDSSCSKQHVVPETRRWRSSRAHSEARPLGVWTIDPGLLDGGIGTGGRARGRRPGRPADGAHHRAGRRGAVKRSA